MILPLWIAAGAAIGIALDNLAVGIGVGVAIGAALTITRQPKQSDGAATQKDVDSEHPVDGSADGAD